MLTVAAAPETQMTTQETNDQQKNTAFQSIGTQLATLEQDLTTLSNPDFFNSRTTSISNGSVAEATASTGTPLGNYNFYVKQLASDAIQQGSGGISAPLSPTDDVSSLVLSGAGFATPVTAGTFTVDGKTITIATSDTLQSVFDQISTATGGAVTGSYNTSTDATTPDEIKLDQQQSHYSGQ